MPGLCGGFQVNATLYDLTDLRVRIDADLEANEGELTDTLAAALDTWSVAFPEKVQSCVLMVKNWLGDAEKIKAEEDRLAAKRSVLVNRAKWLAGYVERCMVAAKVDEAGGPLGSAKFAKTPPAMQEVVPTEQHDFRNIVMFAPTLVRHTPEVYAWDKDAVKAGAKAGTLPEEVLKRVKIVTGRRLALK